MFKTSNLLRAWTGLAVSALALAGVFALLLALSRTPHVQEYMPWNWQNFFHKGLITHVIFSFSVWYLAIMGAMNLYALEISLGEKAGFLGLEKLALGLSSLSFVLLAVPALLDRGEAVLNNYVPVIADGMYYAGLICLFAGIFFSSLRLILHWQETRHNNFAFAMLIAGVIYIAALLCFGIAWWQLRGEAEPSRFNEHVFWGGGHVLQFVNCALLIAAWQLLSEKYFAKPVLSSSFYQNNVATLLLFTLPAPLFYLFWPAASQANKEIFTDILWFGLPIPCALAGLGLLRNIWQGQRDWRNMGFLALVFSLLLFGAGGMMGYFLGVSDTRIPSHYHAVIGGINLVFMGLIMVLFLSPPPGKWLSRQFYLYGIGQSIWSIGMFLAGAQGIPRKTAGAAQGLDNMAKKLAMYGVGLGGVIAVVGGVAFVIIALRLVFKGEGK